MSESEEDFWLSQHEHVGFFGSVLGGAYLLLALPAWLWRLYVEYLWNWDAHPWIKNAAATFRLMAILVVAPFVLLTLLDVGAYIIARTLGVVETTKASTYDSKGPRGICNDGDPAETDMALSGSSAKVRIDAVDATGAHEAGQNVATILPEADMSSPSPSSSSSLGSTNSTTPSLRHRFDTEKLTIPIPHAHYASHFERTMQNADGPEAEACFFSPSDERQLELSGALLSSPAPSRQASPGLERRHRVRSLTVDKLHAYDAAPSARSDASSTADSEPFTVLESLDLNRDGPEGFDSALDTNINMRRRAAHRHDGVKS
ncbi:hypothetical protein ACEPAF_7711 [Sanghuangporus sanghuang]